MRKKALHDLSSSRENRLITQNISLRYNCPVNIDLKSKVSAIDRFLIHSEASLMENGSDLPCTFLSLSSESIKYIEFHPQEHLRFAPKTTCKLFSSAFNGMS